MKLHHRLLMIGHFIYTRWWLTRLSQTAMAARQKRCLKAYLNRYLPQAASCSHWYGTVNWRAETAQALLDGLPMMDKSLLLQEFAGRNTAGITLEQAQGIALDAEQSRDFSPRLGSLSVGLSSGTSGQRGVFLVSESERARWAGILLAKTLPGSLLRHLLSFWRPALGIAFFLRANNNLYQSLNNRRIRFCFYDLLAPGAQHIARLNQDAPQVLVAPASVLQQLAQAAQAGELRIAPKHIISVAEVLEPGEAQAIGRAFAAPNNPPLAVHQIYQATEGFLGYTCEAGGLHLNETHLHIEKCWLDASRTRFQPVITDFSRTTQLILRYQLNDVLHLAPQACECGRAETTLVAIEGRADDILWLKAEPGWVPVYPDLVRRCLMLVEPPLGEYRLLQRGFVWTLELPEQEQSETRFAQLRAVLADLADLVGPSAQQPRIDFALWKPPLPGVKRRRIQCLSPYPVSLVPGG